LNRIPEFYLNAMQSFSEFRPKFTQNSLQDILDTSLLCNENIKYRGGLRTIRNIWDEEILNFKDSIQIYTIPCWIREIISLNTLKLKQLCQIHMSPY
jgi:hypothetical protein